MPRAQPLILAAQASALALIAQGPAAAQTSAFSTFTPIPASVPAGSLPESAPFFLSNPAWTQRSIADRTTRQNAGQFNSGTWDMIDTNRTGADRGRYLFTGFETNQPGIQRTDRVTGTTVTLWNAPTPGAARGFDAARWPPFGTYLTAEESWGPQPQSYGRRFELTNPVTAAAGAGNLIHRNAVARVSHEGLAFDKNNNLYYIDEANGGSIYRFASATPNTGATANATGAAAWINFSNATGTGPPAPPISGSPATPTATAWRESVARWMTMSTIGAEPSGLYFDVTNPNIAFINIQHPTSGVDRMIEISAVPASVPEPGAVSLLGVAAGILALSRRR